MAGKYSVFGKQIMQRLLINGMTLKQLADAVGTTSQYMTKILYGKRSGKKYKEQIESILKIKEVRNMCQNISLENLHDWCTEAKGSQQYALSPIVREAVGLLDAFYSTGEISCEGQYTIIAAVTFYYSYAASRYYGTLYYEETDDGCVEFTVLTPNELNSLLLTMEVDSGEIQEGMDFMIRVQVDALRRAGLTDEQIRQNIPY